MNYFPFLSRIGLLISFLILVVSTRYAIAQEDAEKAVLELTTESDEAAEHFWQGLSDFENIFFSRSAMHFEQALEADPDLALAGFMHAMAQAGLNQAQRLEKMDAAIGKLGAASIGELLFAVGIREGVRNNNDAARTVFEAAAALLPDDPHIAFQQANSIGSGGSPERILALRKVTEDHPDFAPPYNILAYGLWGLGDEAGARENVMKYMQLASDHPNSHDSYAELFQFSGLYNEAAAHYNVAINMDASYTAGYTGLAEVQMHLGDADAARDYLMQAEPHISTSNGKINLKRAIAKTYLDSGDSENGMKMLETAAEEFAANEVAGLGALAYRERAAAEALFGEADQVQMFLDKAAEVQSANAAHHIWSAIAHGLAGNADAARAATDAYKESNDGEEDAIYHTVDGLAKLAAGDHNAAESALKSSGLQNPMAQAFMVRCQKEMGHDAEAASLKADLVNDNSLKTSYNVFASLARLSVAD